MPVQRLLRRQIKRSRSADAALGRRYRGVLVNEFGREVIGTRAQITRSAAQRRVTGALLGTGLGKPSAGNPGGAGAGNGNGGNPGGGENTFPY